MTLERNPAFVEQNKIIYTCPMHPQIEQDHPGNCPICGMTLEPRRRGSGRGTKKSNRHQIAIAQVLDRARAHDPGADRRDGPCDSRTAY